MKTFGDGQPGAHGGTLTYRLDVIASGPADVVHSVGGWLYDRARAGWDVAVLLPQLSDSRALRILGMHAADLDAELLTASAAGPARGLAVSAEMYASDARIEHAVLSALDRWMTEVTLWQHDWPLTVGRRTTPVLHVLSDAARAFKRQALSAAGMPGTVGPIESLLSDMKASLPIDSELIPVG